MVELKIDMNEMQRQLKPLLAFPKEAQAAVYQSVKKTMGGVRTQLGREIKKESTLKANKITESMGKVQITMQGDFLEGSVRVASQPIHLSDYQVAPKRATAQRGRVSTKWRPVRWKVERNKAFKENKAEGGFSKAFAAYAKSGKLIIFRRKKTGLEAQWGPRVQYFLAFKRVHEPLEKVAKDRFEKTLEHEVAYRLSKIGAR